MRNPYLAFLALFLNLSVLCNCGDDGSAVTVGDVVFDDPELQRCYEMETNRFPANSVVTVVEQLFCPGMAYNIKEISGIGILSNLRGLDLLRQQEIDDYRPLLDLSNLTVLEIREGNVNNDDLDTISRISQLEWLDLTATNLRDVTLLSNLENLEYIALASSSVTRGISALAKVQGLQTIVLDGNPDLPCDEFRILKESLPDASITPENLEPGVSCSE